jgi:hypothetical protein
MTIDILISVSLLGIIWVASQIFTVKKAMKPEEGASLIGKTGEVLTKNPFEEEYTLRLIDSNGNKIELSGVRSKSNLISPGQSVTIIGYVNGKYYID